MIEKHFTTFALAAADLFFTASLPNTKTIADAYRCATDAPLHWQNTLHHFPPASQQLQDDIYGLVNHPPSDALPLISLIAPIAHDLQWRGAGGGKMPALGAVELIGPCGVVHADNCRSGIFYQPQNYYYPYHKHAAEELYVQLCGSGTWHAESRDDIAGKSGMVVHHQSWQPHALTTVHAPLLAMWAWWGDIDMESYALCE